MRDADVRHALLRTLRDRHDEADTLLVEELDLLGQVRVDVAVVNGAIRGDAIKSAKDTRRRLPRQVELYSRDRPASVLVGGAGRRRRRRRSDCRSSASRHPESLRRAAALVQLMWGDEALAAPAERGLDRGVRSKPRRYAWDRLVQCLELTDLQAEVRRCLKARTGWRGHASPA